MKTFGIESSIPVLPMLDEAKGRAFYVDYLGYEVDWEHRFGEDASSPLYMEIRLGDSVIHLNGHAELGAPVCEVRIPVRDFKGYCECLALRAEGTGFEPPEIVDPRYEGRLTDMNIVDPFGNHLVFWTPNRLA